MPPPPKPKFAQSPAEPSRLDLVPARRRGQKGNLMLSRLRVGQALFFTAAENKRLEVERIVSRHVSNGQGVFVG